MVGACVKTAGTAVEMATTLAWKRSGLQGVETPVGDGECYGWRWCRDGQETTGDGVDGW